MMAVRDNEPFAASLGISPRRAKLTAFVLAGMIASLAGWFYGGLLVIYTDPDDAGYRKGVPYPEGGWANETCIQRGSLNTLDYPGDPLTPGIGATEDAVRLDPEHVALPRIPVQPVGYGAAREIMLRMKGAPLPAGFHAETVVPMRGTKLPDELLSLFDSPLLSPLDSLAPSEEDLPFPPPLRA